MITNHKYNQRTVLSALKLAEATCTAYTANGLFGQAALVDLMQTFGVIGVACTTVVLMVGARASIVTLCKHVLFLFMS